MLRDAAHDVVAESDRLCEGEPGGILEKWIQAVVAPVVEIDVYAPVMYENKVSKSICSLYGVLVARPGVEKPGVVVCNEVIGRFVCPELKRNGDQLHV